MSNVMDVVDEKYVHFVRQFEAKDPEPEMALSEQDKFIHNDRNGKPIGMGRHYPEDQVARHMQWLHRFHAAYREWVTD